ncbi:nucleotidyl transferase AbiEii/AbiGii toxin family protein [Acidovorax sp. Root217]|uniref:nucleotidyl transferase AbiEii/AbiGii toxin family protein n=1 Tax=Acidovorax sp. Root217 TaxID=1736492 RepID=UPI001F3373B1|nr:nucleotidyl transferase AbiEii/AbiGii toxin family protein [Acidovorax sp. Root217]
MHAKAATQALGIDVFVGGAMARDIMLTHVYGQAVLRATRDVDIGLYIDSWERFAALKDRLAATGAFFAVQGKSHRMHYLRPGGIPLDLIPFGGVEGADQTIAWPPGHDVVLNVAGFREGLDSADLVDLGAGLSMHVCTLPSLSVLKLLAWRDRGRDNNKDATDFLALAQAYASAGNMDRLYDEEAPLLEMAGHDPDLAGAALLGKDAAILCSPGTAQQVHVILADPEQMLDALLRVRNQLAMGGDAQRLRAFIAGYRNGFLGQRAAERGGDR